MSIEFDINTAFEALLEKLPQNRGDILFCQFTVCEGLAWDSYAGYIVKKMLDEGLDDFVDSNMRCYIDCDKD